RIEKRRLGAVKQIERCAGSGVDFNQMEIVLRLNEISTAQTGQPEVCGEGGEPLPDSGRLLAVEAQQANGAPVAIRALRRGGRPLTAEADKPCPAAITDKKSRDASSMNEALEIGAGRYHRILC